MLAYALLPARASPTLKVTELRGLELAANWTSAAGALEGILELPWCATAAARDYGPHRTRLAYLPWLRAEASRRCLPGRPTSIGTRWCAAMLAPGSLRSDSARGLPADDDWGNRAPAAIAWATRHLDAGRPLMGWDFHLHEYGIVYGYDRAREGFLVEDVLSGRWGRSRCWRIGRSAIGRIELFAPLGRGRGRPDRDRGGARSQTAHRVLRGRGWPGRRPAAGHRRAGLRGRRRWTAMRKSTARATRTRSRCSQAARMDGADFLADVAASLPR